MPVHENTTRMAPQLHIGLVKVRGKMLNRYIRAGIGLALVAGLVGIMQAQERSTLVLKSGERLTGDLIDLNASGLWLRMDGRESAVNPSNVARIEFSGGQLPADAQSRLGAGQPLVLLKSGQVIDGRLADISGSSPLHLTFDTSSGQREFVSSDVAQVYMSAEGNQQAAAAPAAAAAQTIPAGSLTLNIPANQAWTDTGLTVRKGEQIQFFGSGDIMISPQASSGVGGSPIPPSGRLPLQGAQVGSLIARVGNGDPFLVASNTSPLAMPANGRLQIGVNDTEFTDNSGSFTVAVARLAQTRVRQPGN